MLFDYGVPVGIHPAPPEADDFEGYFSRNLLTADLQTGLDTLMNTLVALGKAIDVVSRCLDSLLTYFIDSFLFVSLPLNK